MKPPISVTVTGANIQKSAYVAETIMEALAEKGFTNATYHNPPPPKLQAVLPGGKTKSLLDQIRATYPDFLEDPVHVWAIPVLSINDDIDPNKGIDRAAAVDYDGASTQIFVPTGIVGMAEESFTPQEKTPAGPDTVAVVKRAAEIATRTGRDMEDDVFQQAAKELHAEGKIGPKKKAHLSIVEKPASGLEIETNILADELVLEDEPSKEVKAVLQRARENGEKSGKDRLDINKAIKQLVKEGVIAKHDEGLVGLQTTVEVMKEVMGTQFPDTDIHWYTKPGDGERSIKEMYSFDKKAEVDITPEEP